MHVVNVFVLAWLNLTPSPIVLSTPTAESEKPREGAEVELQSAQQAVFVVCERMYNALLAWATTKDVRNLLAAQRSLTAVQNQQGDT